jgi:hypothetical protein
MTAGSRIAAAISKIMVGLDAGNLPQDNLSLFF